MKKQTMSHRRSCATVCRMSNVIGIDLGGTKIAVTKFDASTLTALESNTVPTHAERQFSHVYDEMLAIIASHQDDQTVGVGIGVPGLVRQPAGTVVCMPNIPGSDNVELLKKLRKDLTIPVAVENDANCFALAEALMGTGKGHSVFVGITLGTGVGGGIVINGELFRGANGFAAELGHMLLAPGNPPYQTNDKRGDVEQFLSGNAMGKRCEAAGKPEDYLEGEVCSFMRPEIFKEVAWLCVNLSHCLDPSMIAFGGSAGKALKQHLPSIEEELKKWMLPGTPLPKLSIAELPNAATLGAALLVTKL